MQQYVRDNIDVNLFYRSLRANQEQVAEAISSMIVFSSNLTRDPFIGDLSGTYVAQLIEALAGELRKNPSPVEVMESILIGQKVLAGVEDMFRNPRR